MERTEIEKILNKKKIKEANGYNTHKEETQILSAFMEMCNEITLDNDEVSENLGNYLNKYQVLSSIPYIICKEHLPLYFELYNSMVKNFNVSYEENMLNAAFFNSFELFEEFFVCHYGEQLLKYADWAAEEKLTDISVDDIPVYDQDKDIFEQLSVLFSLFDRANNHLEAILSEYNKGKCMCFYPVIHNLLSKISFILFEKKPC